MKHMMLGLALTALFGHTTQVLADVVYLTNNSGRRLCIATIEASYSDQGTSFVNDGWRCIEPAADLQVDYDAFVYVAIIDDAGRDYVADSPIDSYANDYRAYVPGLATDKFGIEVLSFNTGGFTYSYFLGDDEWSHWNRVVDTAAELDASIRSKGFKQFKTYLFKAADNPGGLGLSLN